MLERQNFLQQQRTPPFPVASAIGATSFVTDMTAMRADSGVGSSRDDALASPFSGSGSGCSSVFSTFRSTSSVSLPPAAQTPDIDIISCTPAPSQLAALHIGSRSSASSCSGGDIGDPNNKKYFCQRCLNHKEEHPRKGHKPFCRYRDCECNECQMVEKRRRLNNALNNRKPGDGKNKSIQGPKPRNPKCARCTAHGEDSALRGHKKALCPFRTCGCERCVLVEERRRLMADQIKLRRQQKKARQNGQPGENDDKNGSPTPPALLVKPTVGKKAKKPRQPPQQQKMTAMTMSALMPPPSAPVPRPSMLPLPPQPAVQNLPGFQFGASPTSFGFPAMPAQTMPTIAGQLFGTAEPLLPQQSPPFPLPTMENIAALPTSILANTPPTQFSPHLLQALLTMAQNLGGFAQQQTMAPFGTPGMASAMGSPVDEKAGLQLHLVENLLPLCSGPAPGENVAAQKLNSPTTSPFTILSLLSSLQQQQGGQ